MVVGALRRFFAFHRIEPCRLVVAVSGGTDSSALLSGLAELRGDGFDLIAGHVNHHLRGSDADADEAFVRELCETVGIPLRTADGTIAGELIHDHGIEGAAREVRTQRLQEIRSAVSARYIATAHQMNDQAETVLMRLFTGSGIAGLRGIHPVRADGFIRPLLEVPRTALEEFLRERGIEPRIDSMNADPRYLRVRIRQSLRPYEATVIRNIASAADQAREQWSALEKLVDAAEKLFVDVEFDEARFNGWPENAWLRRALLHRHIQRLDPTREISGADLARIDSELAAVQRLTVTKSLELVRRGGVLILRRPRETGVAAFEMTLTCDAPAFIPPIATTIAVRRTTGRSDQVSRNRTRQPIQLPPGTPAEFVVRNRREGDSFRPLGMPCEKKLKEFLIDRKIPAEERDRIPLVLWNGEIVWVGGVEVAETFKVTASEGDRYELSIERES